MKKIKSISHPVQKSFDEIATEISLESQLISDITGLDEWQLNEKSPAWACELAQRLLRRGWTRAIIVLILLGSLVPLYADQYQDLSKEYNQIFAEQLLVRIQHIPKNSFVEISLKDGSTVMGIFKGFHKYDDSIWILPQGKYGIFADEAYNVRQLENIRIVEPL